MMHNYYERGDDMRTTLNISEEIIKEAEALYNTTNRSKAVEMALKDAIRLKKIEKT